MLALTNNIISIISDCPLWLLVLIKLCWSSWSFCQLLILDLFLSTEQTDHISKQRDVYRWYLSSLQFMCTIEVSSSWLKHTWHYVKYKSRALSGASWNLYWKSESNDLKTKVSFWHIDLLNNNSYVNYLCFFFKDNIENPQWAVHINFQVHYGSAEKSSAYFHYLFHDECRR